MSEAEAVKLLQKCAGLFDDKRQLSLGAVAVRLDCSVDWVRAHLSEFPNAWRMPGGELRIPVSDVNALARGRRLHKKNVPAPCPA